MLLADQVGQSPAIIPEEALRMFGRADDPAGQRRQPGSQIVAAPLSEFRRQFPASSSRSRPPSYRAGYS